MAGVFSGALQWIINELAQHGSVAASMSRLIDRCEAARPHADWAKLRSLPYGDLARLESWIARVFRNNPPSRPLRGLWFGLFNPIRRNETLADLHVVGSEKFIAHDIYAWSVDAKWIPRWRYARSSVLAEIYRIAYPPDDSEGDCAASLSNDAEYTLCLGYSAFAVREVLRRADRALILGPSSSLGIAVGFDAGDFILLGRLTKAGLGKLRAAIGRACSAGCAGRMNWKTGRRLPYWGWLADRSSPGCAKWLLPA